jgi:hypothetical protein
MPYHTLSKNLMIYLKKTCLLCVNILLCGIARACIKLFPLTRITPYFGRPYKNILLSTMLTPKQHHQALHLCRSISLASQYTPWHSNCLTQALVARFWCYHLNIPYILYIGFKKDATSTSGYAAHAWLTAGSIAITGGHSFSNFHVVSSYLSREPL